MESHASFLMLEFAANLLGEIERWMLTASPNMIDLTTFADVSDKFLGANSFVSDMRGRFPAAVDEVHFTWNLPLISTNNVAHKQFCYAYQCIGPLI